MKLLQFFVNQAWWGKLIGAIFGYLTAGATGALFGILIGNLFDRGLAAHLSRPHQPYYAEKRQSVQRIFFDTTFSVMGCIAKSDGRVSEQTIRMAETLMKEMKLNRTQRAAAQNKFNEGKKTNFNLAQRISILLHAAHDNPELLKLFIDIQYRTAKIDGLSFQKQQALNTVLKYLGFAPLNNQYRFYEDFVNYSTHQQNNQQSSSSYQHRPSQRTASVLDHAYGMLEILPTSNKQEVKRAYRRLMSRNHPDKMIAKGLPEEAIKKANEKTQKIRKAYEQICSSKGW